MAARSSVALKLTVDEAELDFELAPPRASSRPELAFDFSGQRSRPSKGPVSAEECSTIKQAIVRWLEEQL